MLFNLTFYSSFHLPLNVCLSVPLLFSFVFRLLEEKLEDERASSLYSFSVSFLILSSPSYTISYSSSAYSSVLRLPLHCPLRFVGFFSSPSCYTFCSPFLFHLDHALFPLFLRLIFLSSISFSSSSSRILDSSYFPSFSSYAFFLSSQKPCNRDEERKKSFLAWFSQSAANQIFAVTPRCQSCKLYTAPRYLHT